MLNSPAGIEYKGGMNQVPGSISPSPVTEVERFEHEMTVEGEADNAVQRLRADRDLQLALAQTYGLPTREGGPGVDFSNCSLLACPPGGVGFVLEAQSLAGDVWGPTQRLILKLLHYSRLDDDRAVHALDSEAKATKQAQPGRYLFAGAGALVTVRAPGVPLPEWLERQPWWQQKIDPRSSSYISGRVEAMRDIGVSLCRALHSMRPGLAGHGNLDLNSILVTEEAGSPRVNLIDLTPDRPPDLTGHSPQDCVRSDARGIGVAMLQAATPYKLDTRPGLDVEDVQRSLAALWGDAPAFARIVEDLVDPDPSQRLAMLRQNTTETGPWLELEGLIQAAYEFQRMFRPPGEGPSGTEANVTNWGQVRHYFQATRHLRTGAGADRLPFGLLRWLNVFAYAVWVLALTGFVLLTSADIGLNAPSGATASFIEKHAHFTVGDFDANFPGRLIAISFAYVALTFYMRILAGVTVRRLGLPWIELAFRSAPLVLNIPVLVVIYYEPRLWAAAATGGILAAVVLCLAMREIDKRGLIAMEKRFRYSPMALREAQEARTPHESWWRTLGAYLLVVLVPLDLGLYSTDLGITSNDVLRDGAFYALLLTLGCNFYAIYWNSIRKLERNTRGCLEQSSFILRRAARLDPASAAPSVFTGSQVRGGTLAFLPAIPVFALIVYSASTFDRQSVELTLTGIGVASASLTGLVIGLHDRRQHRQEASVRVRALLAVAVAAAIFAFLSIISLTADDAVRLILIFLSACGATAIGDQVFKQAPLVGWNWWSRSGKKRSPRKATPPVPVEAFEWAETALGEGQSPNAVSAELGRSLIGTDANSSREEVGAHLIGAWELSPNTARLSERLLLTGPEGAALVVQSASELNALRSDLGRQEAPKGRLRRIFLSPDRAQTCLASPADRLSSRVSRGLRLVGISSVAIGVICTLGWLFYLVTDPDWTRTAGRTIALSYSLSAVYYYRTLVGWLTVTGLRRRPTELALRTVPFVFQGPAVTAIFLWPTLWPVQATIGIGATALVNYLLLMLIRDAATALHEVGGWSAVDSEKLPQTHFASWWTTAAIYLSGLLVFDLLLTATHVLHDGALYALVLAAGANFYLIVFSSLRKNGASVRGQVTRAIVLLRVLTPTPERVPLRIGGPRMLLVSQAALAGLAGLWLNLVDGDMDNLALAGILCAGGALSTFLVMVAIQGSEPAPNTPRAQAISRLMASLICWATASAIFAAGSALHVEFAAAMAFAGALGVGLILAEYPPPPPPPPPAKAGRR